MPRLNPSGRTRARLALGALALLMLAPSPAMALDPDVPQWSDEGGVLEPDEGGGEALPDADESPDEGGGGACPASDTPLELLV